MADACAESIDLGLAADDEGGLAARLDAALQAGAHVLVTSGGVSMGALCSRIDFVLWLSDAAFL